MKWRVCRQSGSDKAIVDEYEGDGVRKNDNVLRIYNYLGHHGDMSEGTKTVAYVPLNKFLVERVD